MVLAGGPDRERPVSLNSGAQVASALEQAGHEVRLRDVLPENLAALDEFTAWPGDAIFPILHGAWGEGGALQHILDERQLPYVGSAGPASALCMDKQRTKLALQQAGLPTPNWELLVPGQGPRLAAPVVIKPPCEGSSIDLFICRQADEVNHALAQLHERHARLLVEQYIEGMELTVGVIADPAHRSGHYRALPAIRIVPATAFYDYQAKYHRDDTRYLFGSEAIGLPESVLEQVGKLALEAHRQCGCRHLSRVDFMVDRQQRPWILEINTLPGFTSHSLLPMAAGRAGYQLPQLVDHLVRLATR